MLRQMAKWMLRLLFLYFGYVFLTSAAAFAFIRPQSAKEPSQKIRNDFYGEEEAGADEAAIIEGRLPSLKIRLELLEKAKYTVRSAYFSIEEGEASDLFYGQLLKAADRGVHVDLLYDGKGQTLFSAWNETYWALKNHPNIEMRFFEPFDWLKPWTWNNRLHDKFLIIDDTYVLNGGVNMEDRFLLEEAEEEAVYDRDVLIRCQAPAGNSVLTEFSAYFDHLWTHPFTVQKTRSLSKKHIRTAEDRHRYLVDNLEHAQKENRHNINEPVDWESRLHPTRSIHLLTNPIQRWKKDPLILQTLNDLFQEAQKTVIIQSPYLIPNHQMQKYVHLEDAEADFQYVTNAKQSSPNPFAMAGQEKHMDDLEKQATQIYEYHGEGSIHAKACVIDGRLSLIGSFNLDPRSTFLSSENLVIIDSEPLARVLTEHIEELAAKSLPRKEAHPAAAVNETEEKDMPRYKKYAQKVLYYIAYPFDDLL